MDELTEFQKEYLAGLIEEEKEELAKHADKIDAFKKHMFEIGVNLQDDNFKFYRTTGIVATYPNIITFLHKGLISDKEGLWDFKSICQEFRRNGFVNGYLYSDNFMIMAHSYFRRGFHHINNFAPRFVDLFWGFNDDRIDTYIALDSDKVRINVDDSNYMERDTWYGAQFKSKIEDIPDGVVKLRPPMDLEHSHISFFFSDAYSLDIKWATKDGIKSFQAEEFKTEDVKIIKDGNEYYPVRYVHAEFDIRNNHFQHFDGAIHFYSEDEYFSRRDSDFNFNAKNISHIKTLSQKLFKMNGIIDNKIWIEFTSHFLTGNPLVFEYFEGEYPQYIQEILKKVRYNKIKKT